MTSDFSKHPPSADGTLFSKEGGELNILQRYGFERGLLINGYNQKNKIGDIN
jgi:hypothetical protein